MHHIVAPVFSIPLYLAFSRKSTILAPHYILIVHHAADLPLFIVCRSAIHSVHVASMSLLHHSVLPLSPGFPVDILLYALSTYKLCCQSSSSCRPWAAIAISARTSCAATLFLRSRAARPLTSTPHLGACEASSAIDPESRYPLSEACLLFRKIMHPGFIIAQYCRP